MTGDKWFSTTHVQPKPFQQTAYSKHSHPVALNQQLAQTCSKQVVHVDDAQQPDVTLPVELAAPTTPTQALLTAPSRALMLRPPAAEPPAVPKQHVLLVEHQHTLVLRPLVLTLLLLSPPAEHPPHASLICTTVAAASSVQRLLGIGKVHSPVLPADGVQDHAQLPHLGHALCNTSCMCCLVGGIGQATTTTTSTLEAPLKAPSQHAAIYGARADSWLDRHGGSWLRTHAPAFSPMLPVMGASMLGCIFTGMSSPVHF